MHEKALLSRTTSVDPEPVGVAANELTLGPELLVEVAVALAANAAASAAKDVALHLPDLLVAAGLGPRVVHAAARADPLFRQPLLARLRAVNNGFVAK